MSKYFDRLQRPMPAQQQGAPQKRKKASKPSWLTKENRRVANAQRKVSKAIREWKF